MCQLKKCLWVFDFDDTLVKTSSRVHVIRDEEKFDMTTSEYVQHVKQHNEIFDYSDFQHLIDPQPIEQVCRLLRDAIERSIHLPKLHNVIVLTARGFANPVHEFLTSIKCSGIEVVALVSVSHEEKAHWINKRLEGVQIDEIHFFDDSLKNIEAVQVLVRSINVHTYHVSTAGIHHSSSS